MSDDYAHYVQRMARITRQLVLYEFVVDDILVTSIGIGCRPANTRLYRVIVDADRLTKIEPRLGDRIAVLSTKGGTEDSLNIKIWINDQLVIDYAPGEFTEYKTTPPALPSESEDSE